MIRCRLCFVWLAVPVMLSGFVACHTARKSYWRGEYERAIHAAVNKLQRSPTDEESIIYLEAAYQKLYRLKTDRITFLRKEGRPENVLAVYDEMSLLKDLEAVIKPLLPLHMPSRRRNAQFRWIADADFIQAKKQAAEYLYARANQLLKSGVRADAREAFVLLEELRCIYPDYVGLTELQRKAVDQGTNKVNLRIVNKSGAPLFHELERHFTNIPIGDLQQRWVQFYNDKDPHRKYDYEVVMSVHTLIVTPDLQLPPNSYVETKTVPDGWTFLLDEKGNPVKDSTGAYIKQPKYKTIRCTVTEFVQQKSATLSGYIEFYRYGSSSQLYAYPLHVQKLFAHHWAVANGDLEALSPESMAKIRVGPVPFPSEIELLVQASDELKLLVKKVVLDHIRLLSN